MLGWFQSQVEKSDLANLFIFATPVLLWGSWRYQDNKQEALESVVQASENAITEMRELELQRYVQFKREIRAASGYNTHDPRH